MDAFEREDLIVWTYGGETPRHIMKDIMYGSDLYKNKLEFYRVAGKATPAKKFRVTIEEVK